MIKTILTFSGERRSRCCRGNSNLCILNWTLTERDFSDILSWNGCKVQEAGTDFYMLSLVQQNSYIKTKCIMLGSSEMTYSPLIVKSDIQPENRAVDDTSLSDIVKSVPPM